MALISPANLKLLTDKFAAVYDRWLTSLGDSSDDAPGTDRYLVMQALDVLVSTSNDYDQQQEISSEVFRTLGRTNRESLARTLLQGAVSAISSHIASQGSSVDASVVDLPTYLAYYNGGSGGAAYSSMLHPAFAELFEDLFGDALPPAGVLHPAITPLADLDYPDGMGRRAVGGSFVAGEATDPLFADVTGLLEVITTFSGGSAPPTFSVAGVDNTGVNTTTWTATGGSDNPASAVSTTITPTVTAMSRQTVTLASVSGVVVGSVLTVRAGLWDEETVIVEAVAGSTITAVFIKAHAAGATITGLTSLVLAPSVVGRRISSVTNITIGVTGHAAGAVRVAGVQDRQYNPNMS